MRITGKAYIEFTLKEFKVKYQKEFQFHPVRKFRFDYYFEVNGRRIGVEYDGLVSTKSRHTTIVGFSADAEKTNLAQLNGFIVLRYTIVNYKNFYSDLKELLR